MKTNILQSILKNLILILILPIYLFGIETISIGSTIEGSWVNEEAKKYSLTVNKEIVFGVYIKTDEYTPGFSMEGTEKIVTYDVYRDYYASNEEPNFVYVRVKVNAGTYTINVEPYSDNTKGDTFTIALTELHETTTTKNIELNSTITGTLDNSEGISFQTLEPMDRYKIVLEETSRLFIHFERREFFENSELIHIFDSDGRLVRYEEGDYERYVNLFAILEAGEYTIEVSTGEYQDEWAGGTNSDKGAYTLSLEADKMRDPIEISINQSYIGTLSQTSLREINNDASAITYYKFSLEEDIDVKIKIEADFSVRYKLYTSNGKLLSSGVEDHKTLKAGNYLVAATSSEFGTFSLLLEANIINTRNIELNSTMEGEFTEFSGISNQPLFGNKVERYILNLNKPTDIIIELNQSSGLSASVMIDGRFNNHVLGTGTHIIDVTSSNNALGIYSIKISEQPILNTKNIIPNRGAVYNRTGEGSSYILGSDGKTKGDLYIFTLTEKSTVFIHQNTLDGSDPLFHHRIYDANTYERMYDKVVYHNTVYSYIESVVLDAGTYIFEVFPSQPYYLTLNVNAEKPLPVKMDIASISANNVSIKWNNSDNSVFRYGVYLDGKRVAYLSPDNDSYTFDNLKADTSYTYAVRAFNSKGVTLKKGTFKTIKNYAWLVGIYGLMMPIK